MRNSHEYQYILFTHFSLKKPKIALSLPGAKEEYLYITGISAGTDFFTGQIPRQFAFERTDPGKRVIHRPDGTSEPDQLLDDSALAYRSSEGIVIITGCSHAGICNITEYAREVCGDRKVTDIIGGFHLIRPEPERMKKTGAYPGGLSLKALHACYCTSLPAKIALAAQCPVQEAGVGLKYMAGSRGCIT